MSRNLSENAATENAVEGGVTIDTVVLDFGNVLIGWDPYAAYANHTDVTGRAWTAADIDAFFDEVGFDELNHEADSGRPFADIVAQLERTHPHRAADLAVYVDRYADTLTGPVPGSETLVRELARLDLRLFGLTNWSAETFRHAEPAAPAIGLLHDVVVSGRVGLAKPDTRIYELLAQRFDVDPARAVFVDDKQENVDAARRTGFHAIRFTDTATLRARLRALGIGLAAPAAN
ncbi:HAD family hydrolase [Myceligenerans xiligouense]|uniref:2-haloacid dehalogenase n=1 Tax=Myceligenerans xiligouense TaxID=253184 RepID=A0A3N4Z716_9MICO|nr:HAD family phosphatase [Myceligenerans xiligouense]RPF21618.1 2-haloacid dehalogenase [Myceligenerans xiligouense]